MNEELATDELRRMLDERGIEWKESDPLGANAITRFCVNGIWLRYVDYEDYCWIDYHEDAPLTPAQAIAATVGRSCESCPEMDNPDSYIVHLHRALEVADSGAGTCHITVEDNLDETEGLGDVWLECDECHWQMMLEPSTPRFKFCPNCGRRIEVDE